MLKYFQAPLERWSNAPLVSSETGARRVPPTTSSRSTSSLSDETIVLHCHIHRGAFLTTLCYNWIVTESCISVSEINFSIVKLNLHAGSSMNSFGGSPSDSSPPQSSMFGPSGELKINMTIDPFCGWEKNRYPFPMNDVQIIYANLTFLRGLLDSQLALSDNAQKSSEKYFE